MKAELLRTPEDWAIVEKAKLFRNPAGSVVENKTSLEHGSIFANFLNFRAQYLEYLEGKESIGDPGDNDGPEGSLSYIGIGILVY